MCGITGIVNSDGRKVAANLLEDMIALLGHRGPDDSGIWMQAEAGFGHTRLSVIDPAGGRQPMANGDGTLCITFNGEIYNYLELRDELAAKGHKFRTRSDTEVLLHLYEEEGGACVQRLNGQWAFAIWDSTRRRLFLSRDRLGVRPLFYTQAQDSFLFASEIKALLAHPGVRRELDLLALAEIFTFWCTLPPRTMFAGVSELPPGHSLTLEDSRVRIERYWEPDYNPDPREARPEQEYVDEFWELLVDATRLRLRADVPVGAYLSGGLDSSVITAIVKKFSDTPVRSFSVTFDDPEFDESSYQDDVIRHLDTDHQRLHCGAGDIARDFPDVIWHTEKTVLRTAPVPLFQLSEAVRSSGYKVVLTGEGSDEILGGYDIFKEAKIRAFWGAQPASRWRPRLLRRLYPYLPSLQSQPEAYRNAFFRVTPDDLEDPYFSHLPRWETTSKLSCFLADGVVDAIRAYDPRAELRRSLPRRYDSWDCFSRAQCLEAMLLLPGYILSSQGDRVAMAHSVEVRMPFLDHRVVEFAARLPVALKMKVLNEKYILKRCVGDLLPASVRRRHKQPYRAPEAKSFFQSASPDYVGDLLSPERIRRDGIFDATAVQSLAEKFRQGRAIGLKDNMALVGILSTQLVIDRFLRGFPGSGRKEGYATAAAASPICR